MNNFCKNKLVGLKFLMGLLMVIFSGVCIGQGSVYSHSFDNLTGFSTSNGSFGTMSGCSSSNNFYGINSSLSCVSGFTGGVFYVRDLNSSSAGSTSATVSFPTASISTDATLNFTAKFGFDNYGISYSGTNTVTFQYKFASSDGWTTGAVMSGNYSSTMNCTDCGISGNLIADQANDITFSMGSGHSGKTLYMQFVISGFQGASENFVLDDVNVSPYCNPSVNNSDAAGISRVTFSNIDNSDVTNTDNNSVEDFTSSVSAASIEIGSSYDLSVYVHTGGSWTYKTKAWVDWNKDGDFNDTDEEYDLGTNYSSIGSLTSESPLSITIPSGATEGSNFIRIANDYSGYPTSCNSDWGEFEDYALDISSPCSKPTTQASSITMSNHGNTSFTLGWTRGSGDNVLVVAKASSAPTDPDNGTSYTSNSAYGSGDACGGGYVVYKGTGTSVDLTNLTEGTEYYFAIYEYNNTDVCYNDTELTGNFTAGMCTPVVTGGSDQAGINRFIIENSDGSGGGIDNTDNTNDDNSQYEDFTGSVSASLTEIGSSYDLSVYVDTEGDYEFHTKAWVDWNKDGDFDDTDEEYDLGINDYTNNSLTSLSPLSITIPAGATTGSNFIRIGCSFNGDPTSCSASYGEFEDYALNVVAACSAPATQASSLVFSDQAANSQTISWTRGNGNNVMVVAKASSSSADPINGTSYAANTVYGSGDACGGGYVIYNGSGTSVSISGLTQGTTYYYDLYEYNSSGTCYNKSELTGSQIAGWCEPVTSNSSDAAGINRVIFSNIDNTDDTNNDNSGVEDFTGSVTAANVYIGSSYDLSVYVDTEGDYEFHTKAWVDWNKDGDFDDTDEEYDLGINDYTNNSLTSLSPLSITIPAGATTGSNFIRIGCSFAGDPTSCSASYGEFEDYALNVTTVNTWVGGTSLNETTWTTASNWSNGTVPTSSESPIIPNVTNQPEITSTVTLAGLTIDSGADITVSSNSLTVTGTFDLNGKMYIENATVNTDGTFDATGGTIDFTNANGKLILSSTVTSLGTLDAAMGTVEYDGSSACDILSDTYYNLELYGASVKTAVGNVTVNGDFTINSGSQLTQSANRLTLAGNVDISGTLNHSGGDPIYLTGTSKTLSGTGTQTTADYIIDNGSYELNDDWSIDSYQTQTGGGTLVIATTKTLTLASTFYSRTNAVTTLTGTASLVVGGNAWLAHESGAIFTLNTGTVDCNGADTRITGLANGTFNANSGTVYISGNSYATNIFNKGTSTFIFDGSTQNIAGENYYNLTISNAGTKTAGGAINVDGDLSTAATAGCKLDMGAYALNIAGDLTVGATDGLDLTDASSLVTFDGSANQTLIHSGNSASSGTSELDNDDFSGLSAGAITTTSGAGVYNAYSSSCSDDQWASVESGSANITCTPCSGNRLEIYYTSCAQDEYVYTARVTPTTTSIDVSFNYAFKDYTSGGNSGSDEQLRVYLYNETTASNVTSLVYLIEGDGDITAGAYSGTHAVTAGNNYRLKIRYKGYDDFGAAIDNVLITETVPSGGSEFNDLTINNSGGNIIFNNEISVDGTITFTSGDIDASSNNLVLTSNATVSGADDDSHVIGTIVKTIASDTPHEFPLGNGTVLRKVNIDPNDATSRDWTVTYTDNVYSDVTTTGVLRYVSDTCYWDISPTSTPASTTVTLNWSSAIGINDGDLSNILIAHYNGTDWEGITATGTTGGPSGGSVSGNVTSFSPFTLGTTGVNPLPVTLTQFEGYAYSELDNKLEWTTKSEKNADYMEIQHSDDGKYFDSIGISKLAGNSQTDMFYEFIDRSVAKKINYYRLKQFDYDGKFNYSKIISIDNRHTEAKVVKYMTNLIGQKVDINYKGVVIIYYTDGSSIKTIQ